MKLKKLLAGVLSAVMVLGTMVMPAFADSDVPTLNPEKLSNDEIAAIFQGTNFYGGTNEYVGPGAKLDKVFQTLREKHNDDTSNLVYGMRLKAQTDTKNKPYSSWLFDFDITTDKDVQLLVMVRYNFIYDVLYYYTPVLKSGEVYHVLNDTLGWDVNYGTYGKDNIDCIVIPLTEELFTVMYDLYGTENQTYEQYKEALFATSQFTNFKGVSGEDANLTLNGVFYETNKRNEMKTAEKHFTDNALITFEHINSSVAQLPDGRTYASLKDAYAAAEDNATITLLKDTDIDNKSFYGKKLTFDLNGHTLKMNASEVYPANVVKDITFKSSADEKGVIDLAGVSVGQAVWFLDDGVTMTFDNIKLSGIVEQTGAGTIFCQPNHTANVIFNNSKVDLSVPTLFDNNGRLTTNTNTTITNTEIKLDKFDGGFAASGNVTVNGTSNITVTNGNHALSRAKLTMNGNSTLTVTGCQEGGIKLDDGSEIVLNDTSKVSMSENKNDNDIIYRTGISDEAKQNVKIVVGKNAILDAKIASEVMENATVEGKANAVSVEFEATDDENVYNIVLTAPSATQIHEFTSAQLKFAKGNNAIGYEIAEANDKISVNEQGDNVYLFNLKSGADIVGEENKIVIGKVIFEGYSEDSVDFKIDTAYENKVVATKGQNITETFTVDNEKLTVNDEEKGIIDAEFKEPECEVTINVAMNEPVTDNKAAYQNMKVVISGQGIAEPIVKELGSDVYAQAADGVYTVNATLKQKNTYIITVSGEGYRTAKYQLKTKEKETATVNFWNNVQLSGSELVMETGDNTTKANANFIAGDIIKDNKLNIYDLSAVVAYFGDKATDRNNVWDKVKYDINRDGKIDAEDVSIVLDAWKALEALGQN